MNATTTPPTAVMNLYARFAETMTDGNGVYLYDDRGRAYLDFYSGIGVNALGHRHPKLLTALRTQAEAGLWHVSNLFRVPGQEQAAQRLTAHSFADVAFFCNSGVEALEGLIKLARRYHHASSAPQRWRLITNTGAFHGRSLATLAAAGNPRYLEGLGVPADGFDVTPFGDLEAVRAAIGPETAAILVEPIQGEGGVRVAAPEYLRGLRALADDAGLLLLLDEVQCGNGRSGWMWAHERAGVVPDALATAKGLGGGFPVGAVLATRAAAQGMTPGAHGTTFGGNPLAMAVANAVLDVLESPGFLEQVRDVSDYLHAQLTALTAAHPAVFTETRGLGLMLGLRCRDGVANTAIIDRLRATGLLTVGAAENVIRLLPPLILERQHVDEAIAILRYVASTFGAENTP